MKSGKRILIAEDEAIVARFLKMELESFGYIVCAFVATGEEAVRKSLELLPDYILMDINLAGQMNGIEAAAAILRSHAIPVVFMTGYSRGEYFEAAKKLKPAGFLRKPVEVSDIQGCFR